MKPFTLAIIFMVCLNMGTYIMSEAEVPWQYGFNSTQDPSDYVDKFDVNATQSSWSGQTQENFFGYIWDGITFFYNHFLTLIIGFPMLIQSFGAPEWIYMPMYAIWSILGILYLIYLMTGREL